MFVLVPVLVELELTVSWSLFVFSAVLVTVMVCVMVGSLVLVIDTVTLVFGEPIPEMVVLIGFCCEATQANPAPRPGNNKIYIKKMIM